jgi:hypothetical protein
MLVLAMLIAMSGHAAGVAQGKVCKEAKTEKTGWGVPPKSITNRGEQFLVECSQSYTNYLQVCLYKSLDEKLCTVYVDQPSDNVWRVIPIDCATGVPIEEKKI